MPSFRFQSLTADGRSRQGVISAAARTLAIRELSDRGEMPVSIELIDDDAAGAGPRPDAQPGRRAPTNGRAETGHVAGAPRPSGRAALPLLRRRTHRPRASRIEIATLIRELATALEAGLPLMSALRTVRRQASGRAMPAILDHMIERVEAGSPLHVAAREYGPPFDDLMVGMLAAADATGKMTDVLHQLADLLERSIELRREVTGATIYPGILAVLIITSVVILVTVLVPRLIEPLAGSLTSLPLPTRILMGVANFLGTWWIAIIGVLVTAWFGWRLWVAAPLNRYRLDRLKLRVPVFGRLLRDVAVARFTRTLGTLVTAGIPILEALRITRSTLGNTAMMRVIEEVQEKVTGGTALAEPLERSGLFPPLLVQVVNLGERSGRLEGMLLHAATAFDRQVNISLKLVTKALPPILILTMAALGGFVIAAILLPLLELQSLVGAQ